MSHPNSTANFNTTLATLRQYIRRHRVVERCELCGRELPEVHQHLVEPESRSITCACEACAILFSNASGTKYRRIPRQAIVLRDFTLTDAMWADLLIPINMAFFFYSTPAERVVAIYPSPAGATESLLSLAAWTEIVEANPILASLQPDVEGLLVNRLGHRHAGNTNQYFIAPIDQCYKLVGLIRGYWRGLSGGTEVWQHIGEFFRELDAGATERPSDFSESEHAHA